MDIVAIKEEIKQRIDLEDDPMVLDTIKDLLNHPPIDPVLQAKLVSRALKAEEDFKAGRFYTREEVIKRTDKFLNK
ncbi:MAG: hypothetical protein JJE09_08410 [Bacteroidia bacterium]|nr:hypothetical protein [Bacteroidia bacterium]